MNERSAVVNSETGNEAQAGPRELSAEELRFAPKLEQHFASTRELAGAKDFVGQERALASLELGLGVAGLTGKQGVLIPASNVRHLILRSDVIKAVAEGKFHIYPMKTIDEGIAILTGRFAGSNRGTRPSTTPSPSGSRNSLLG